MVTFKVWSTITSDSSFDCVKSTQEGDTTGWGIGSVPESIQMTISAQETPTWIAAQELWASPHVKTWMDQLALQEDIKQSVLVKAKRAGRYGCKRLEVMKQIRPCSSFRDNTHLR